MIDYILARAMAYRFLCGIEAALLQDMFGNKRKYRLFGKQLNA